MIASTAQNSATFFAQSFHDIAQYLITLGAKPIPICRIWDNPAKPGKKLKQPGFRYGQEFISITSTNWDTLFATYGISMFNNCKGLGVLIAPRLNDGLFLNRFDWDSPDNHDEIIALFKDKEVLIHRTVSGNLAVLWKSTHPQSMSQPCTYHGKEVGEGAWWALLPRADQIEKYCDFDDLMVLEEPTLNSLGISLKKQSSKTNKDSIADDEVYTTEELAATVAFNPPNEPPVLINTTGGDDSDHELARFKTCLAWIKLGYFCDIAQHPLYDGDELGYDDSYHSWIVLVLITRALVNQYPEKHQAFRSAFLEFSRSFNPAIDPEDLIDEELARPDNGKKDIATLEAMAKTIQLRLGNVKPEKQEILKIELAKIQPSNLIDFTLFFPILYERYSSGELTKDGIKSELIKLFGQSKVALHIIEREWESFKSEKESLEIAIGAFEKSNEEILPLNLEDYISPVLACHLSDYADAMGYTTDTVFITLLTAISALYPVPTKLVLFPGIHQFSVTPNIYTTLVAETGARKSPIENTIIKPLMTPAIQALKLQHELKCQQVEAKHAESKRRGNPVMPLTPVKCISKLGSLEGFLQQIEEYPNKAMFVGMDEITAFFSGDSYVASRKASERGFWLTNYDGKGDYIVYRNRVLQFDQTQNSVWGLIQPDKLYPFLTDESDADGFLARFILCHHKQSIISDDSFEKDSIAPIISKLAESVQNLFAGLVAGQPPVFTLSSEAASLYRKIYMEIEQNRTDMSPGLAKNLYLKLQGRIGKIALNLHLLEQSWQHIDKLENGNGLAMIDRTISADTIKQAYEICRHFDRYSLRLYSCAADNKKQVLYMDRVFKYIKKAKAKGITIKQIRDNSKMKTDQITSAIEALLEMGKIKKLQSGRTIAFVIA